MNPPPPLPGSGVCGVIMVSDGRATAYVEPLSAADLLQLLHNPCARAIVSQQRTKRDILAPPRAKYCGQLGVYFRPCDEGHPCHAYQSGIAGSAGPYIGRG